MALWTRLLGDGTETKAVSRAEAGDATARSLAAGSRAGLGHQAVLAQDNVEQVVEGHYKRVLWVFRCVDAIAQAECSLPIYAWSSHDDEASRADGFDHLERLLNGPDRPNRFEEYWEFRYRISTLLLLSQVGVFVEIVRDKTTNDPAQLTILDSDAVEIVPDDQERVKAYRIRYRGRSGRIEQRDLDPDRVLWLRSRPHPKDPYKQVTPLQAAGLSADTDFLARMFNRNWLSNDGRVAQLIGIKAENGMDPGDIDQIKRMFGGGYTKAGETRVVEADAVSVAQVGGTPQDAQYTDMLSGSKQDLLMAFGLSESFLSWAAGKCVDDETEALTQRGWLRGDEITTDDTILSMDPKDGVLKWSPVHEVYRAHHRGMMYRLKNSRGDFLVTPGHNWAVHPRKGQGRRTLDTLDRYTLKKVEDLGTLDRIQTIGDAECSVTDTTYTDAFVELVGWAVTEGYFWPNAWSAEHRPGGVAPWVRITQNNGPNADRIGRCLKELGAAVVESDDLNRQKVHRFDVRGEVAAALVATAPEKVIDRSFLLALTAGQRHLMLETLLAADGCFNPSGTGESSSWTFAQKDKRAAEVFAELATLCGYTTSMRQRTFTYRYKDVERPAVDWLVIVRRTKVMTIQHGARTVERYDGGVWCPRTDYGTFVARRNGVTVVTGNTFDNSDNEIEVVWQNTMRWHCKAMASGFMPLVRSESRGGDTPAVLAHDFAKVTQLQRGARLKADKALAEFQAGLITADEYREATGKDPWKVAGTQVVWTPAGPVGKDDKTTKAAQELVATNRPPTPTLPGAGGAAGVLPGADGQQAALPRGGGSTAPGKPQVASQADMQALAGKLRGVVNERAAETQRAGQQRGQRAITTAKSRLTASPERKTARARAPRPVRRRGRVVDAEVVDEEWHDEHPSEARVKTAADDLTRALGGVCRRMLGAIEGRLQSTKTRKGTRHWAPDPGVEYKIDRQLREFYIVQVDRWGNETAAQAGFLIRNAASGAMADLRPILELDAPALLLASRLVRQMVNRLSDDLRGGVERRTRDIAALIRRMDDQGASVDEIKQAVADRQAALDRWVAQVAPRVARAAVQGARAIMIDRVSDKQGVKVWKTVGDHKVRHAHRAVDGQVAKRGHGFLVGGYRLAFPGDPRAPAALWAGCRCVTLYRRADGTEH